MRRFLTLLDWSRGLAVHAWPLTLFVLACLVGTVIRYRKTGGSWRGLPWIGITLGFVFPIATVAYGSLFERSATGRIAAGLLVILAMHVGVVLLTVLQARNARFVAICLGACQLWWSVGATFVAGMSITGDWL